MNQLDATTIYLSIRSAQHVSGNILPIIRSVRLRYLQHMVSCKDGYTESYVGSYVIIHECKNIKRRLLKTIAAIWYNKTCKKRQISPKYISIKINGNDISHTKLHNFLYIHLCRLPYAVNISVSRS